MSDKIDDTVFLVLDINVTVILIKKKFEKTSDYFLQKIVTSKRIL